MGFEGRPDAALDFYRGLEADNSKAYGTAHKDVYERYEPGALAEHAGGGRPCQ